MKVKCINASNIKSLENDKIYTVKRLNKSFILLLDIKSKSLYSIKRFNIVEFNGETFDNFSLINFIKNKLINNEFNEFNESYINKRIIYNIIDGKYLLCYNNKINNLKIGEVYKILKVYRGNSFDIMINLKSVSSFENNELIILKYNNIHQNFYQLDDDESVSLIRLSKIKKLKNEFNSKMYRQ